ncbi:MBL fold metallo-hydrolase [Vibrio sp. SCSIO 43136]|uniref:MBL fold metallo-hydrolase n=1 Tax=Vibrio sp. SCSIO 43136 TaxID=2819101 RepID=UPI0020756A14|nr:MBL fold metallo-hydrolase [Vibrio sp. SCSIO 43136]USD65129.1 MBL fold metallo-hydrolase [Vibrio sp. SCSIO 43136]
MRVIHHGGKEGVTGSCHELQLGGRSLLLDCGIFQGAEADKSLVINFPISHVQALVITHSHIDHIGRIPWLIAAGFNKPISCTPATADLLPLMLDDGMKLQLSLSKYLRQRMLERITNLIKPIKYNQWFPIKLGQTLYCRFQPAGHILGSAYVELKVPEANTQNYSKVVFSGDLGPNNTPLLSDPLPPENMDVLYLESTYGDKNHENMASRKERLQQVLTRSVENSGTVIIPAFSVGRTQELLFDIESLLHERKLERRLPIIVDSPMANKVTCSYRKYRKLWGQEAEQRLNQGRHPLGFEQKVVIKDHKQHLALVNRLASSNEPCIVIAASGMCQGGRVMNYLKYLLPKPSTEVLFVGYQANGTLGRKLQSGCSNVEIDNHLVAVGAQIVTISGYSAHAGQKELLAFAQGSAHPPSEIHLIHGDTHSKTILKLLIEKTLNYTKVFA